MSQLNKTSFGNLYGTSGSTFPDNTTGDISEGDMRTFGKDILDSALFITDNFVDEDDMASNSATKVPSQQSVKAYVDAQVAAGSGIGGSTGSTDNALLRSDGTGGSTAQATNIIVDDFGNIDISGGGTVSGLAQIRAEIGLSNSNNTPDAPLRVYHDGGESAGVGVGIEFAARTSTGNDEIGATIEAVTTDVTAGSEDFDMVFKTMSGGATAAERLRVTSDGRVYGKAIHNNTGAITGTTNQYIASGTYTPTLTSVTNIDATTAYVCQFMRVGNVVTVSGRVDVDNTVAATDSEVGISLPIASDLANDYECCGVANSGVTVTGYIKGDITNNRASLNITPPGTANKSYYFSFTYQVK